MFSEGMRSDIRNFIASCEVCQQNKSSTLWPVKLLQPPLPIPIKVWVDIPMDFIAGLPKAHCKDTNLVMVDKLTKVSHLFPLVTLPNYPFKRQFVCMIVPQSQ